MPWELPKKWWNKSNGEIFGWKFNNQGCFFHVAWFSVTLRYEFSTRCVDLIYSYSNSKMLSFQNRKSCSVTKYGSLWINVSLKNGNKLIQKALEVRGMTIENCICAPSQFCNWNFIIKFDFITLFDDIFFKNLWKHNRPFELE